MLFDHLPRFPPALPDDELDLLRRIPIWPTYQLIDRDDDYQTARRLERKGLIKISRSEGLYWVGKLEQATVRQIVQTS